MTKAKIAVDEPVVPKALAAVGDSLRMFHRNNGQPVRDSDGLLIIVPASGVGMAATVTEVINEDTVNLTAKDATGKTFREEHVVVLLPGEPLPRGGRYALRADDVSVHPLPRQFGR
jgi:hypothetical protein